MPLLFPIFLAAHVFWVYLRVDPFFGIFIRMEVSLSQTICYRSDVTIRCEKPFLSCPSSNLFTHEKTPFDISRLQLVRYPIFLLLNHFICFKMFGTVVWSIPNDSASSASVWHESSSSNAFNTSSSNFFGTPERSLPSISLFLKRLNQSACCFRQSMAAISLNKSSMCFSCRFFKNEVVQKNYPHTLFSWHEIRHVNTKKKKLFTYRQNAIQWISS